MALIMLKIFMYYSILIFASSEIFSRFKIQFAQFLFRDINNLLLVERAINANKYRQLSIILIAVS